jgi:hypothetical protein
MRDLNEIINLLDNKRFEIKENNFDGMFIVDKDKRRTLIISWGGGWEHFSVNDKRETPSWEDMCEYKELFWKDDECVVQFHPPKSEYVNNLEHCLHLWKPIEKYSGTFPIPNSLLVGIKGIKFKENKQ